MKKYVSLWIVALAVILSVSPCFADKSGKTLMMATTTSTDNTGLLDYLAPYFTGDTGIELRWTAVGTGKALRLGQNCDVDVLLVHAPAAEKQYLADSYGINRCQVMYNDFVIIGPPEDPAGIAGKSVTGAMQAIAADKAVFASRGDDSGTNKKEISLWNAADMAVPEKSDWYRQTGQGMIATINIAAEQDAYTMTDRGTYIKYSDNFNGNPPLKVLVEGDDVLKNQYSVIAVNPENCPDVNSAAATALADWLTSKKTQKRIGTFKLLGKKLFIPNAR